MKDWKYYSVPVGVEYYGHAHTALRRAELCKEIDDSRMTAADRSAAYKDLRYRIASELREKNKPYRAAVARLKDEFWADARAELGYDKFLSEKGIELLEQKAYDDGHASGFPSIYEGLQELSEFAKALLDSCKLDSVPGDS